MVAVGNCGLVKCLAWEAVSLVGALTAEEVWRALRALPQGCSLPEWGSVVSAQMDAGVSQLVSEGLESEGWSVLAQLPLWKTPR